jgi:hypothetical protein
LRFAGELFTESNVGLKGEMGKALQIKRSEATKTERQKISCTRPVSVSYSFGVIPFNSSCSFPSNMPDHVLDQPLWVIAMRIPLK